MQAGKRRKRGIKASKIKLAEALNACGLSTQIALAEKIADMEGTDLVPKDLVNRAFREQAIEFTSLARIAAALDVEAHTLFLTDELKSNNEAGAEFSTRPPPTVIRKILFSGVAILLILSLTLTFLHFQAPGQPSSPWLNLQPRLNNYAFVLLSDDGKLEQALLKSLNKKLSEFYNVSSPSVGSITHNTNPEFVAEQFGADGVLTIRILKTGRLAAIQYFLYANKVQQAIHVDFYTEAEITRSLNHITHQFTNIFNETLKEGKLVVPPSLNAQREYLEGMTLIDAPYSDFSYTKAQLHLRNAIGRNPDFAEAQAGLCTALTDASWNGDSAEMLQVAKKHCETALNLNKDNLRVLLANGNFKLKSGDYASAKAYFLQTFISFPGNSAAEEGLATVALQQHIATGEARFLDQGEAHSKLALQFEPDSWSARFVYGNLLFYR